MPDGLTNVVAIAAGALHSLALKADGSIVGWGRSLSGQTNPPAGLSNVIAIVAGAYQSLALRSDGSVVAWGANGFGETNVPVSLSNVVAISGGYGYTLAITIDLKIASCQHVGPDIKIGFRTFAGRRYAVEYSPTLASQSWIDLPGDGIDGNGYDAVVTDTNVLSLALGGFTASNHRPSRT
jgi:hypothetical protein